MNCPTQLRVLALAACAASGLLCQTGDPLAVSTPLAMAPGAPRGSYALSPAESVNLANGNLSFSIPLHEIGGRGKSGYMMKLPIGMKWDIVITQSNGADVFSARASYLAEAYTWARGAVVRYTPGRVVRRDATDPSQGTKTCGAGTFFYLGQTLTKIVWIDADGSEHEFRDAQFEGLPTQTGTGQYTCNTDPNVGGPDRKQVFESDDSEATTFFADGDIYDDIASTRFIQHNGGGVAGWLLFADGTRYHTNSDGYIIGIQERVGNDTTISYAGDYSSLTVTDPLNRVTTVTFGSTVDTIQFPPSRTITVNWDQMSNHLRSGFATSTFSTLFPTATNSSSSGTQFNPTVISSVVLQDSSQYSFQYNSYGELARVNLPQGGAYEYDYPASTPACGPGYYQACAFSTSGSYSGDEQGVLRRITERRVYPNGSTLEGKTGYAASYNATSDTTQVSVTRLDSNANLVSQQIHSFIGNPTIDGAYASPPDAWYGNSFDGKEFETDWEDAGGNVLKKTQHLWVETSLTTTDVNLCQTLTTLGTVVSGTVSVLDSYSNVTDVFEYDYGNTPALSTTGCPTPPGGYARHTHLAFQTGGYDTNGATAAASSHIRDLPAEQDIYNSSGTQIAKTGYGYDAGSNTTESSASGYIAPSHSYLGNLTSITKSTDGSGGTAVSVYTYDNLGDVLTARDPNGNVTTHGYADVCDANAPLSGVTYAFPTQVKDALLHATNYGYDCATGNLTHAIDPNMASYNTANSTTANTVAAVYADPFERVTNATRSQHVTTDETQTAYSYTPTTVMTYSDLSNSGDRTIVTQDVADGLGRPAQHLEAFGGGYITVLKRYDGLGRPYQTSNPYQSGTETANYTTTSYDALDRVTQVAYADGSAVTTSYTNNTMTVTDAAGVSRKSTYDALGRLISVAENPAGVNAVTSYTYDALDDLLSVTQPGLATGCSGYSRYFQYDWAKRLTSTCNPESGTVTWTYYPTGNAQTKTDARGVVTTFGYDALNRLTSKTYSGAAGAPNVTYSYDATEVSNSIGRLTQTSSSTTSNSVLGYDTLGRVTSTSQTTNGATYTFSNYSWNRAGGLLQMIYPSGRAVSTGGYDALVRPGSVSAGATSYASSVQYASHGAVKSLTLGNGIVETTNWNMARLQPTSMAAGSVWNASFYYCASHAASCATNNGNLLEQDFTQQSTNYVQIYSYDALSRISGVSESKTGATTWSQTFGYDNFGNRAVTAASGSGTVNAVWTATATSQFTAKNQFVRDAGVNGADRYDAAGNQISVASSAAQPDAAANTMAYDAENRMVSANIANTGSVNYTYDGDGRRVMKSIPATGAATVYVYDGLGQLAAEYSTDSPVVTGTTYLTQDHLGSTRLVTNAAGAVVKCYDYMPFGEEIPNGVGGRSRCYGNGLYPASSDVVSEKFTGKERDSETGLDFFETRYFSSAQGRFTSPDQPFAGQHVEDPQSWNMYAYVRNNPLRYTDPDGRDCFQGFSSCADFLIGGAKGLINAATSGIMNSPTTLTNALISPFTSYQFQTVFAPPTQASNSDQQQGMESMNGALLASPLSEIGVAGEAPAIANSVSTITQNAARGAASEARVLNDLGLTKNTEAVAGAGGKSIPDFQTSTTIGEIKDVKQLSNTQQLRIQRDAAQQSGRDHVVITGTNTSVTPNVQKPPTKVVRRDDLGPNQ